MVYEINGLKVESSKLVMSSDWTQNVLSDEFKYFDKEVIEENSFCLIRSMDEYVARKEDNSVFGLYQPLTDIWDCIDNIIDGSIDNLVGAIRGYDDSAEAILLHVFKGDSVNSPGQNISVVITDPNNIDVNSLTNMHRDYKTLATGAKLVIKRGTALIVTMLFTDSE